MRRKVALIPGLAAVLAAGVASANGGGHLWGSSWQVAAVGEFDLTRADSVTIGFAEGNVAGRSGCNRYAGTVTLQADRIAVGALAGTRMACPVSAMEIERHFLEALEQVTHWRIAEDGTLELLAQEAPIIRALAP